MQGLAGTVVLFLSAVRTILICLDDVPGDKGVPLGHGYCDWKPWVCSALERSEVQGCV